MSQRGGDPESMAEKFIKGEVEDEEMALSGAKDIIAEWINENAVARARMRQLFQRKSILVSKLVKGKEEDAAKFYQCGLRRFSKVSEQSPAITGRYYFVVNTKNELE